MVADLHPSRSTKIDPVKASVDWWDGCSRAADVWWTRVAGARAVSAAAARRTQELLQFARAKSPFYEERWRALAGDRLSLSDVPGVTKGELMARFDDWATDRSVTRAAADKFLADLAHIGELFLGKYLIWKSSGSSGETGIFVQDRAALSVYDSLLAVQMQSARVASRYAWGLLAQGGRAALVVSFMLALYALVAGDRRPFCEHRIVAACLPRHAVAQRSSLLRDGSDAGSRRAT